VNSTSLLEDFGIDEAIRTIVTVGAGGKTSLMYALARQIASRGKSVVSTTTTKIGSPKPHESPDIIVLSIDPALRSLPDLLEKHRHVTVASSAWPGGKLDGVANTVVRTLLEEVDVVIVEADGAARLSVKAPEAWEPVIPECADLVIPVVGLDCIGKPATEQWAFRLERFLSVTGLRQGEAITAEAIARLLLHPDGGLKGVPSGVAVTPFLNKLDKLEDQEIISRLTEALRLRGEGRIKRLVAGRLRGGIETRSFVLS
jgi:probable selenium-dependent hydroxylase accessory protein YqeC